jgi:excisionase family DNA binding protein
MSTRQAAAFLGVGRNKLLRLLQTKRIKAKDLDGRLRFTTESLREFLDALPDALEAKRPAPSANGDARQHYKSAKTTSQTKAIAANHESVL